jgi:hypothetical protein
LNDAQTVFTFYFYFLSITANAQKGLAPKPLYDDPVYHGAADPVIFTTRQRRNGGCYTLTAVLRLLIQQYSGCMEQGLALQKARMEQHGNMLIPAILITVLMKAIHTGRRM